MRQPSPSLTLVAKKKQTLKILGVKWVKFFDFYLKDWFKFKKNMRQPPVLLTLVAKRLANTKNFRCKWVKFLEWFKFTVKSLLMAKKT